MTLPVNASIHRSLRVVVFKMITRIDPDLVISTSLLSYYFAIICWALKQLTFEDVYAYVRHAGWTLKQPTYEDAYVYIRHAGWALKQPSYKDVYVDVFLNIKC